MKEILDDLDRWRAEGRRVAVARVVEVSGSGPRQPGAAMAVTEDGEVAGSVSGGCVEGAVVAEALDVLARGGHRLVTFGYSDEDAFAVGLTCGGTVRLFIEELDATHLLVADAVRAERPFALVTVIDGPGTGAKALVRPDGPPAPGDFGVRAALRDAGEAIADGVNALRTYTGTTDSTNAINATNPTDTLGATTGSVAPSVTTTVFIDTYTPPPRMIILGAVDFSAALARAAKLLGYRVTVCDARATFATHRRFPMADEIVVDWPHRYLDRVGTGLGPRDAVCVLTHDAKFDVPAVLSALRTDVGYLGAMGSRRTHEDRRDRLRAAGAGADELQRLMSPIGLAIGARTPEETAVAICAEIIALRGVRGATVASLRDTQGPVHPRL
ncbi:XdhC/CoxI family protein [Streptomyces sp. MST-110588]|uniref:XdhC family protein n=1 Tax=Streptomyces sp. MST-110588 TaxID=2833628 RepID=UPI001F5CA733|nr:XdhC/CoxI family protein [Streptomyces sp. MST-110588]UNO38475.1 XdhC family protein [Streptomyces sp. MST-110588]